MTNSDSIVGDKDSAYDLTVIIPCTPDDTTIQEVLQPLSEQEGLNFEVLLVMNPKSAPPPAFPSMKLRGLRILSCDRGANRARNKGLAESRSELVLFLDADCCVPHSRFLFGLVQRMKNHPTLTAAGGAYHIPESSGPGEKAYNTLQLRWLHRGLFNSDFETRHLLGGFLLIRKSYLKGYEFDEKLIFGGTERELLRRLHQDGHAIRLWPDLSVTHLGPITPRGLAKKAFSQGQGARYILEKLGPELPAPQKFIATQKPTPAEDPWIQLYQFFFEWGFTGNPLKPVHRLVVNSVDSMFQWLRLTENRLRSYQAKNH